MDWARVLPIAMIAMSTVAGIIYLLTGNVRQGIYWIAAAVLNAAVTF